MKPDFFLPGLNTSTSLPGWRSQTAPQARGGPQWWRPSAGWRRLVWACSTGGRCCSVGGPGRWSYQAGQSCTWPAEHCSLLLLQKLSPEIHEWVALNRANSPNHYHTNTNLPKFIFIHVWYCCHGISTYLASTSRVLVLGIGTDTRDWYWYRYWSLILWFISNLLKHNKLYTVNYPQISRTVYFSASFLKSEASRIWITLFMLSGVFSCIFSLSCLLMF